MLTRSIATECMRLTSDDCSLGVIIPMRKGPHVCDAVWLDCLVRTVRMAATCHNNERRQVGNAIRDMYARGLVKRRPDNRAQMCTPESRMARILDGDPVAGARIIAKHDLPVARTGRLKFTRAPLLACVQTTDTSPRQRMPEPARRGAYTAHRPARPVPPYHVQDSAAAVTTPPTPQAYEDAAEASGLILAALQRRANPTESLMNLSRPIRELHITKLQDHQVGRAEPSEGSPPSTAAPAEQPAGPLRDAGGFGAHPGLDLIFPSPEPEPERLPSAQDWDDDDGPDPLAGVECFEGGDRDGWPVHEPVAPPSRITATAALQFWADVTGRDVARTHMTPERERKLFLALKGCAVIDVHLALAWGAVSVWHRDNGRDAVEVLLRNPDVVARNRDKCLAAIAERAAWFRAHHQALRDELDGWRMIDGDGRTQAERASMARFAKRVRIAGVQAMRLARLADDAKRRAPRIRSEADAAPSSGVGSSWGPARP